ncbi:MAG: metallophosphoesterase [Myxococcaceae bacterium]
MGATGRIRRVGALWIRRVVLAYGHFIEPFWLDISRDNVVTTRLRDGERLRIVHISDLHVDGANKLLGRLAGEISSLRPDLVIFTGDALNARLLNAPEGAFKLLAYHTPDLIEDLKVRPDLYLAGHTHGGQVRLPRYGALVTMSRFDKKYEMGRYEIDGTVLYVNRGIGTDGGHLPRIRFMARPEIAVIDLVGRAP